MNKKKDIIEEYYAHRIKNGKEDYLIVGWESLEAQKARFDVIVKNISLEGKKILDVGCGEGLGTWLLAKECGRAKGVDIDKESINIARRNWKDGSISFDCGDFLVSKNAGFNAVVSFDVVEHILPKNVGLSSHL